MQSHINFLNIIVRWAIVLALSVLLLSMATGQAGIANYMELKKNKEELQNTTISLMVENQKLEDKIKSLNSSKELQVRFLKSKMGYVEENEYLYIFKTNGLGKAKTKQASQNRDMTVTANNTRSL